MFVRSLASLLVAMIAIAWPTRASELSAAPPVAAYDEIDLSPRARVHDDAEAKSVPRKVHLPKSQITVAIAQMAKSMLDQPWESETIRTVDGKVYAFCVEPHYHAPESGKTPVGWHKGVTVYTLED